MCFLVGRNVDIDIVGHRQQNIRFFAEFNRPYLICVLKWCLPYISNRPTRFRVLQHLKGKGSFYIAQYPVRWTAQSALHLLPSLTDLFIPTPFSASPGSILARQQLRAKIKSLTFPPLSIARYSFIQMSRLRRREAVS